MFGLDDAVGAVATLADSVVKRSWPDATAIEQKKLELLSQELQSEFLALLGQVEVNKIEAQSDRAFVSGWRPFVGWVCGVALMYAALIEPMARFVAVVGFGYSGAFPVVNTDITLQILLGLLGLATMRSFDKKNGIAKGV